MGKMSIDKYIRETEELKGERNRTLNISDSIHSFLKKISHHYNTSITVVVSNVLLEWKDKYEDEINDDIINKIKSRR